MKALSLLIVDDETATREGLRTAIDFKSLGISSIAEASNGLEGLRIASSVSPDIIISDVRMPRMDGVQMLERVRSLLPDCVFIFMSGYSDKEYLKAAIRLRAVSYVEKPLHFPEIEEAVKEAVALCRNLLEQKDAASVKESVTSSRLALRLTFPTAEKELYELSYLRERYGKNVRFSSAATILLKIRNENIADFPYLAEAEERIRHLRSRDPIHIISAEKHPGMFVLHLYREGLLKPEDILDAGNTVKAVLPDVLEYYITCGPSVGSVTKLYDSYSTAAVLMEQAYFLPSRSVYSYAERPEGRNTPIDISDEITAFIAALDNQDRSQAENALKTMKDKLAGNTVLPRHSVTASYYRAASRLIEYRQAAHLPPTELTASLDTFIYALSSCFSFDEMHALLKSETVKFFKDLSSVSPESTQVYMIREYIRAHYDDPYLSTKEISEYIMLSASYACTLFKNETGKTLNQYLTEFRMEKAKQFLANPRGTITNIASRCGYNDSNYFGKAFKKYTGLSPSEYRDTIVK